MPTPKATHRLVFIVAQIHGPGLIDMLRYDKCFPASERESAKLERAIGGAGRNQTEWVVFSRAVPMGVPAEPCVDRWRSFNITCLPKAYVSLDEAERVAAAAQ